ncbi:MAG: hypothetical protein HY010_00900 [Acidobacteria bacterium]|nr:hypothetical protein [Acidobacteriota bacterium]
MHSSARRRPLAALFSLLLLCSSPLLRAADLKPEEVLAKHLDSIGSAQVRSSMKSRVVQGFATYRVLVGGSGAIDGKYVYASEGDKSNYLCKINSNGFRGEQIIYDGNRVSVAGTYLDKSRSEFGDFLINQDAPIRENLLGGVWSSGWPLLDLEGHKAKLHSEGTKKVDGREFIVLRYQPKKGTDLSILLYFDPQSYQHLMTTYRISVSAGIGTHGETSSSQKQVTRYQIEEKFSDYQTTDGLTLPSHYDLRFSQELDNGFSKLVEWEVKATNIVNNIPVDARSFQVK